jgi:hypothetical protein
MGSPVARANSIYALTHTEALFCCFASAFVPISDENQDGGRAFSRTRGKSQLRFAGSGPHSPPRRRTRGLRCDLFLPCKKRAISGTCLAGKPRLTIEISTAKSSLAGPSLRFQPLGHTASCVLAEPSNNNKKSGWGQRFPPHPGDYFPFYSIECSFQAPFS